MYPLTAFLGLWKLKTHWFTCILTFGSNKTVAVLKGYLMHVEQPDMLSSNKTVTVLKHGIWRV